MIVGHRYQKIPKLYVWRSSLGTDSPCQVKLHSAVFLKRDKVPIIQSSSFFIDNNLNKSLNNFTSLTLGFLLLKTDFITDIFYTIFRLTGSNLGSIIWICLNSPTLMTFLLIFFKVRLLLKTLDVSFLLDSWLINYFASQATRLKKLN